MNRYDPVYILSALMSQIEFQRVNVEANSLIQFTEFSSTKL